MDEASVQAALAYLFPKGVTVRDGLGLHQGVPSKRWCVSRADLISLRNLATHLLQQGHLQPTDEEPFDVKDRSIGPLIRTTTDQLIKPVTAAAGGASWALMLHPEGLECDLFITHCWQEGIFEFLDKVLYSWPRRAQHAYCCMLSNPQNLDIGSLIDKPADSPFAHALHASTWVLVVPNRTCSIYSRIWCVYEAYLGYREGKLIFTATPPVPQARLHTALLAAVSALSAVAFAFISAPRGAFLLLEGSCCVFLALAGSILPGLISLALAVLAAAAGGGGLGVSVEVLLVKPWEDARMVLNVLLGVAFCCAASIAGVTRLRRIQASKEALQLRQGYTGKLVDAGSSKVEDKERILAELQQTTSTSHVEESIQVLLDAGMSTPTLRAVSAKVGRMRLAAYVNWPGFTLAFAGSSYLTLEAVLGNLGEIEQGDVSEECCDMSFMLSRLRLGTAALAFLSLLAWLLTFLSMERDKRGFAAAVLTRLGVIPSLPLIALSYLVEIDGRNMIGCFIELFIYPTTALVTILGPLRTSQVPRVGPLLVRAIMKPWTCKRRQWFRRSTPDTDRSDL